MCVRATSTVGTPATLVFILRGRGVADQATITITQDKAGASATAKVTTAGTTTLARATLDKTTLADVKDFSLCLVIANKKISDLAASATYTLTVGGTSYGDGTLVEGSSNLAVSGKTKENKRKDTSVQTKPMIRPQVTPCSIQNWFGVSTP